MRLKTAADPKPKKRAPKRRGPGLSHSTGEPTSAQLDRFARIKDFGCLACYLDGKRIWATRAPCDVHHMLRGNVRIGHDATVGLCGPHHKRSTAAVSVRLCKDIGPSWHEQRREFRERYRPDDALVRLQNEVLGLAP